MELPGKLAVVTGGASGIGAATARRLSAEGARIVIFDIDESGAEAVADKLPDATARRVDVADSDAVGRAFASLSEVGEGLDILVNCAGIGTANTLMNMPVDDWRRVLDVNLSGPFYCLKHAVEALQVNGGSVVNIASIAGKRISYHGGVNYTASKAGLLGLTRHAAFELAPFNIRVNAVCPGPVLTPMVRSISSEEDLQRTQAVIPLGRWAQPEEIAELVLFLAGPRSSMCTGASFDADGGVLVSNGMPYSAYMAKRDQSGGSTG